MSFRVEAVYENGILKLDHALPLAEHQRVHLTIREEPSQIRRHYGNIGWQGDPEVVRKIACDPEFGIQESP